MGGIITIGDRVRQQRRKLGLTQAALAIKAGVTQGAVSGLENGRNESSIALPEIAKALNTTVEYLITGIDNTQVADNVSFSVPVKMRAIPVISFVQAGNWKEAIEHGVIGYMASNSIERSSEVFGLIVQGKSMLPDFSEGDYITVDPNLSPHPGDYVIAQNGKNETTFKKYRPRGLDVTGEEVFELTPLNPDFPTLYSDREHIAIIGTVVEHIKKLR